MDGQLIYSAYTYDQGRNAINEAFSGEASMNVFSAETIYSGSTNLYDIFSTSSDTTRVQGGLNIYTGGTSSSPTVNISAATLDNITVSGNAEFSSVQINSIDTGSSIYNLGLNSSGKIVSSTTISSSSFQTLSDGATIIWDYTVSSNAKVELGGNRDLIITGVSDGDYGTLLVKQDATGNRTLSFGSGTHKVVNGGGGSITLSSDGTDEDMLTFVYTNSTFYWNIGYHYS
jgi:hypothetical protein